MPLFAKSLLMTISSRNTFAKEVEFASPAKGKKRAPHTKVHRRPLRTNPRSIPLIAAVLCPTHSLKARGQWQNPDVTRIAIEYYRNLRKTHVTVTTYEVKQFLCWNVNAVFEAASHHRFSHEAYVVLEWPNGVDFSLTDPTYKLNQIVRECQRFGVGLATLHPYYNSFRLRPRLEPAPKTPDDDDVETWLDYVFSRNATVLKAYNDRMQLVQDQFVDGRKK